MAQDTSNDMGGSGNSLRDLLTTAFASDGSGPMAAEQLAGPLELILSDDSLASRLEDTLRASHDAGHLGPLPLQLQHLAQVDRAGGPLSMGETSALHGLIRLLSAGNSPMVCSIDLWVTKIEFNLGNLSQSILEGIAQQDPANMASGVDLLGDLVGAGLSQAIMETIAASGLCPTLTSEMVGDLQSIDRLGDPAVGDLTYVLITLLQAMEGSQATPTGHNRIPELVDTLDLTHRTGLVPPVEGLLRDIGDSAFVGSVIELVPHVFDPRALETDLCTAGPADWDDLRMASLGILGAGEAAEALRPVFTAITQDDGTWTATTNLAGLLVHPEAHSAQALELIARTVEATQAARTPVDGGEALGKLADWVADADIRGAALRMLESQEMATALGTSTADVEGPLPFSTRLILDGTLPDLLELAVQILTLLDGLAPETEMEPP
jgi:hypothetical protein